MPSPIVFHTATLFDSATGQLRPHATVTVEGECIAGVAFAAGPAKGARGVDLAGRTLLPGLIDGHVHVTATIPNFFQLTLLPQSLIAAQAKDILAGMLMRGFTTVRDAGGADSGLVQAVERGHIEQVVGVVVDAQVEIGCGQLRAASARTADYDRRNSGQTAQLRGDLHGEQIKVHKPSRGLICVIIVLEI